MARGAQLKEEITKKILETFPGSFVNDKEIRICGMESGEQVQIKVTLTAAKTNIESGNAGVVETSGAVPANFMNEPVSPSEEEKKNVESLMKRLGLA